MDTFHRFQLKEHDFFLVTMIALIRLNNKLDAVMKCNKILYSIGNIKLVVYKLNILKLNTLKKYVCSISIVSSNI